MPDATTLSTGVAFEFNNNSSGLLTIQDSASATITTITAGGAIELVLLANGTVAGTWDVHGYLPENVTWGTNTLNLGSTVISGGTWQGGTIGTAYGGTGLTTFTAANSALYSTSSSALAAGTLPVLAGGTGVTTSTGTGAGVHATSPTLVTPLLGTPTSGDFSTGTFTWPTFNQSTTGSAATLTTGRTIAITGDLAYTSGSFNGSANVTGTGTLATVNTNVGSFTNASLTVNAKGLITAASSGTAPVTSVTGTSPVASSGGATPAISLSSAYGDTLNPYASKTANFVLAAPNGAAGVPTFRAVVAADIPTLNQNTTGTAANVTGIVAIANGGTNSTATATAGGIGYGTGTAHAYTTAGTSGQVLTSAGAGVPTWTTPTTGTVTGVTATSPVASSGGAAPVISLSAGYGDTLNPYASKTANFFLAAPNGAAGVPTFRAIVAADIPTLNQNTTGNAATATTATSAGNLTGGSISGNYTLSNATSPNTVYLQFGDNTGWTYRFMTSVAGTPTTRFSFVDSGNFTAVGTIAGTNITAAGNVTGTATNVTGTVAFANGGTGATTRQDAIDALAGATTSGQYLRGNGTDVVMASIVAGDVPTLNQNTTGTAGNVTGTVAILNGGTGATTRQDAMDALAGATTSGQYLRGNGTDVVMSAIQAADVPTLNQNTTGTAANVTGTVAIANGGTGATSAAAALTALGAYPSSNPSGYTSNTGTVTSVAALTLGTTGTDLSSTVATGTTTPVITLQVPTASATNRGALSAADWTTFNNKGSGTVTSVTGTSPVASSGGATPAISLSAGYGDTLNPYASKSANTFLAAPNGAAGVPTFRAVVAADIPTLNQNTSGTAAGLSATLVATSGGTGQSTYAIGDLLQGAATNTLSKLAAVATGNALISGGVTTASSWGKIGLTTHVSGTLPIANGGTNGTATPTLGGVIVGTGTAYASTAAGTTGQVLLAQTGAAPIWGTVSGGVTSLAGTTNQITASASTGAVTLSTPSTFIAPGSIAATTTVTGTTINATQPFIVNSRTATVSYSIPAGSSASSAGPITINSGVVITVPTGAKWVVL
jgi:hypothetical protein